MIAALILWILAAVCNAVMDTLEHHFDTSIFRNEDRMFWDPAISWRNKYVDRDSTKSIRKLWIFDYPVAFTDAWHFFKSLMIVCICGTITSLHYAAFTSHHFITTQIDCVKVTVGVFILFGILWNVTFSLFYNRIFRKRNQ